MTKRKLPGIGKSFSVLAVLASAVSVSAQGIPAGYVPMAINGKILLDDNFSTPDVYSKDAKPLTEGWSVRVAHQIWKKTVDGVQSTWASGHNPVLVINGSFSDAVIELDFRFRKEAGRWGACRISPSNQILDPRAYTASFWANDDSKSRPPGLVLDHEEWPPGGVTPVSSKAAVFEPDTWYTMRMELIGNEVQATSNGVTLYGTHPKFGIPKTSIWIGVGTSAHELRNLRVYQGILNPAWNKNATKLIRPMATSSGSNSVTINYTPRMIRFRNLPAAPTGIAIADLNGSLLGEWSIQSQHAIQAQISLQLPRSLPSGRYLSIIDFNKKAPLCMVFQTP